MRIIANSPLPPNFNGITLRVPIDGRTRTGDVFAALERAFEQLDLSSMANPAEVTDFFTDWVNRWKRSDMMNMLYVPGLPDQTTGIFATYNIELFI